MPNITFNKPTYYKGKYYKVGQTYQEPTPVVTVLTPQNEKSFLLPKGYAVYYFKGTMPTSGNSHGVVFSLPLGGNGVKKEVIGIELFVNNFPSPNVREAPANFTLSGNNNMYYVWDYSPNIDSGDNAGKAGINIWNLSTQALGRKFRGTIIMCDSDAVIDIGSGMTITLK